MQEKLSRLRENLQNTGRVAVAFSAGVDSAFLLSVARSELGDDALALTVRSVFTPKREIDEAEEFCRELGVRHIVVDVDVLGVPSVEENPPERCYFCKRALFSALGELAREHGAVLCEGSNADDTGDYRPGLRAVRELGVKSPLLEAGLTKAEIRALSRELGLPTWDKPSMACLASRFVYGERLTAEGLSRVETAEETLRSLGLREYRVRVHGSLARIEVPPQDIPRLAEMASEVHTRLRALGFSYVTLDLQGYRTGSMNETLIIKETAK